LGDDVVADRSDVVAPEGDISDEFAPWIRIDYEPIASRGVLHGERHLHISGFPQSRFLVRGVPTPKQFVEFIMVLRYPEVYHERRLNGEGKYADAEHMKNVNSLSIACESNEAFALMTHIVVPHAAG